MQNPQDHQETKTKHAFENKIKVAMVRGFQKTDEGFIYSTWLRGLSYRCPLFKEIPKEFFYDIYGKVVNAILSRPTTLIYIACLKDDPEIILSYSIQEKTSLGNVLHWVYTKQAWRELGLARKLIDPTTIYYTHQTTLAKYIKPLHWKYNPLLI